MAGEETKEPTTVTAALGLRPDESMARATLRVEDLFEGHHETVFRAAYRVTGSNEDAEDVQQTVFLKLAATGVPRGLLENPGGYLRRAAINAAIDLVRSRKSARNLPLDETVGATLRSPGPGPDTQGENRELRERLRRALGTLSARSAEILVLRYFEGYGNKEIARLLDTSESAVAVILHRARHRLRQELVDDAGDNR